MSADVPAGGEAAPVRAPGGGVVSPRREVALVDLLDRLLGAGVVVTGSLTLGIADVDLVRVDLRALLSSVGGTVASPWEGGTPL